MAQDKDSIVTDNELTSVNEGDSEIESGTNMQQPAIHVIEDIDQSDRHDSSYGDVNISGLKGLSPSP